MNLFEILEVSYNNYKKKFDIPYNEDDFKVIKGKVFEGGQLIYLSIIKLLNKLGKEWSKANDNKGVNYIKTPIYTGLRPQAPKSLKVDSALYNQSLRRNEYPDAANRNLDGVPLKQKKEEPKKSQKKYDFSFMKKLNINIRDSSKKNRLTRDAIRKNFSKKEIKEMCYVLFIEDNSKKFYKMTKNLEGESYDDLVESNLLEMCEDIEIEGKVAREEEEKKKERERLIKLNKKFIEEEKKRKEEFKKQEEKRIKEIERLNKMTPKQIQAEIKRLEKKIKK